MCLYTPHTHPPLPLTHTPPPNTSLYTHFSPFLDSLHTYIHAHTSYLHPPPHTHSFSSTEESDFSDPALPATPLPHYQQGHCWTYSSESSREHSSTAIPSLGTPPHPRKWVFYEERWALYDFCIMYIQSCTCKSDIVDGNCYYVINDITTSLVLPYFGISSRPKNFDSFHHTVLSLEMHVGYRMHCTSEKLISNEQHGHKKMLYEQT